jgi:hypothetical protein
MATVTIGAKDRKRGESWLDQYLFLATKPLR